MPEASKIIEYKDASLYYTEGIDISEWPYAKEFIQFKKDIPPEKLRILKRLYLMTNKSPYSYLGNYFCNEPTIITTGESFFANPISFYNVLGIQDQQTCDPKESDGVMLRTALLPSSLTLAGKALSSNMFGATSLTAIMDKQQILHYFHVGGDLNEIQGEEVSILQQKMAGTLMVVPERPFIQRQSWNMHLTSNYLDVGRGFVNRREMTTRGKDPTTHKLDEIFINLYENDGTRDLETFDYLVPSLRSFLKTKSYLQDCFNIDNLTLDGRLYWDPIQPKGLQIFDFKEEKQSNLNEQIMGIGRSNGLLYDYSDDYYKRQN